MGVRGLTTFIRNNEKKYLKSHKLHNCTVLLDGNSVASNLFIWSNIDCAFGGDYDKFAKYVKEFFKVLQKCEIKALVIFDGGYEDRKLKTVYSRMKDKFRSAQDVRPLSGSMNFPLFMRTVFREVLMELNVPFAQSDFEADDELAALARQLQCPVISNDSDFYIYDVLYIPLSSLSLEPLQFKSTNANEDSALKYYVDCKIYSVDVFIESFGGLDRSLLPLLAALLGNDYIKRSVFKAFYTNLKIPKGKTHPLQRRIKAVIQWLKNESFESAVPKILGRMKKHSRRRVMRQLKKIVNGYIKCSSILCDNLGVHAHDSISDYPVILKKKNTTKMDSNIVNIIDKINENLSAIDHMECNDKTYVDLDDENVSCDEEDSSESSSENSEDDFVIESNAVEMKNCSHSGEAENVLNEALNDIPLWLLDYARNGKIHSCVIDILSLKQYFFPPQVEDYSLTPSIFISLPILNAIIGVLWGNSEFLVKYWTRNGSSLDWYTFEPIYETHSLKFPNFNEIIDVSEDVRKAVVLEVADIDVELTLFPEKWHLFVIALLFWLKNMKEPAPSEAHLHTIVMCLVAIFTIDSKIGVHRNRQTFMRKYKNFLNKVTESNKAKKDTTKELRCTPILVDSKTEPANPKKELDQVSNQDCVLIFETILPYHHLNEQIKSKPKLFSPSTIHAFAQFQSCLFHIMVLNSVLGFPYKETVVSHLYSGTFTYNIFTNLSKRNNINAYIETLFQTSPSLLHLYKSLIHLLEKSLIKVDLKRHSKKSYKKKTKHRSQLNTVDILNRVIEDDDPTFFDENNVFSRLSLKT